MRYEVYHQKDKFNDYKILSISFVLIICFWHWKQAEEITKTNYQLVRSDDFEVER